MIVPATFRNLFERFADGVPTSFLQSLAYYESNNDPRAVSPTGADGLFQITQGVRDDFNRSTGRTFTENDMYDPAKCAEVAVWHLNQIQDEYFYEVPEIFDLVWDQFWTNRQCVELLVLGYTAGWNTTQGVAMLANSWISRGRAPVDFTLEACAHYAGTMFPRSKIYVDPAKRDANGWGPYMSDPSLVTHVRKVVDGYFDTADYWADRPSSSGSGKTSPTLALGLIGLLGLAGIFAAKRKR